MSLIEQLGLVAHPEGGWFRETWAAPVRFTPPGYPGPRAAATAITFLLRYCPGAARHRVRSDELWLWQGLGPLRLRLLGGTGPAPAPASEVVVGPDPAAGHLLQVRSRPGPAGRPSR